MANISGTFNEITVVFALEDTQAATWLKYFCKAKGIDLPELIDPEYQSKMQLAISSVLWDMGDYLAGTAKSQKAIDDAEEARQKALSDGIWNTEIPVRPDKL